MKSLATEYADLYRVASSASIDDFPDEVLARLHHWIQFDGAVFGFGASHADTLRISNARVHRRDPEILEDYARVSHADPVTAAFLQHPTYPLVVDAATTYRRPANNALAKFVAHHDLRHLLLFGDGGREYGPLRWIVLYRGTNQAFEPASAQRLWTAWQHVSCALDLNRAQTLNREEACRPSRSLALVDSMGAYEALDPAFRALIGSEWPESDGSRLPQSALYAMPKSERYVGRAIEIVFRRIGSRILCRARSRHQQLNLTAREHQVAAYFAQGRSHKEVARLLHTSPNTVRAQLTQIYRKLGVNDKAALANRLAHRDDD